MRRSWIFKNILFKSERGIQMKILAVTACPVGIAHTYMAAENLQKAGEKLRYRNKSRNTRIDRS